ncbi:hypothetical protein E5E09_01630 [Helicobacter pylori]|nr:hypothetical protein [Helicobacter pylori]WRG84416.1 hypothetical protein E5E09_01630 [Helicobacter pylori]
MENDVKEDLEQARPKLELKKQKQELEEQKQEKQDKQEQKPKQEKEEPKSKEQEEIKKQKRYRYIFWGCLIVLFVIYFSVKFFAYSEPSQEAKADKPKKLFKYVEKILPTDIIKDNIDSHQAEINAALNSGIEEMNSVINTQIDGFFDIVENNVDKFLDWHYSLKGNYSEFALFVAKKIGLSAEDALFNKLQEKLLGADYKQRLKTMTDNISDAFISLLHQHKKDTEKIATQGAAGIPQVAESLKNIDDRIERNLNLKMGFAAAIGATASVRASALMKRLAPKLVKRLGTKLGAKFLAKFGIAVGGVLSALGADVAFNYIDEWLHRDDFKKEILNNINEVKKYLKESYKMGFDNSITKFSQELQEDLKNIETISVKAHVEKLNQTPEEDNQKNNQ